MRSGGGRGGGWRAPRGTRVVRASRPILSEQSMLNLAAVELEMRRHLAENCRKRSNLEACVVGNREVVLPLLLRGKPKVAAALPRDLVPICAESLGQVAPTQVPRQLHAAITSSWTRCSRRSLGASAGSK